MIQAQRQIQNGSEPQAAPDWLGVAIVALLILATPARLDGALRLPALFSDHLVLQAERPAAIWGWADVGTRVEVDFANSPSGGKMGAFAITGPDGRWSTKLPALPAGASGRIQIRDGTGAAKTIEDVLVGQVWLASGQSNMSYRVQEWNVAAATLAEAKREAAAVEPNIRFFMTEVRGSDQPEDDVPGRWMVAAPDNVARCSAIAWYFGVALRQKLLQPMGLIVSAVSGTPIQAWIPKPEFNATHASGAIWKRYDAALGQYRPEQMAEYRRKLALWLAANPTTPRSILYGMPAEPFSPVHSSIPARLYYGMVSGLVPYDLRGIIWFQADGNAGHPEEYPELIKALIGSWRKKWNAELPFYYVEVNNMNAPQQEPVEGAAHLLPAIREAQDAALELSRTGVVAAIDLGIAENPHFPYKKPLGDRMARLALSEVYRLPMGEVHSPQFKSFSIEGNSIRLHFDYADGLSSRIRGKIQGFAIRGAASEWQWAEGKIDGQEIVVWSRRVAKPIAVRYGWADNPVISIVNGSGLPLRPFRTDPPEIHVP